MKRRSTPTAISSTPGGCAGIRATSTTRSSAGRTHERPRESRPGAEQHLPGRVARARARQGNRHRRRRAGEPARHRAADAQAAAPDRLRRHRQVDGHRLVGARSCPQLPRPRPAVGGGEPRAARTAGQARARDRGERPVSALDDLARILAERELDVGDLIRQAEDGARADVAETLRRLFADDLLRRVGERLGGRPLVALAGVADGLQPLVLDLAPGDLDNEARLERLVREHNELLLGALEEGAVVPFRFGTTFPDRATLDEWLERHREALSAELERLRGTAEWSVEPVGRMPDVEAAEYLGARLATTVKPGLRDRLATASEDAARDAYLVAKSRQDEFGAAVADLEAEGYELRVTGPWPPYSFARLP